MSSSKKEKLLIITSVILVIFGIGMTLWIGLVLPKHILFNDFINSGGKKPKEIANLCKCYNRTSPRPYTVEGIKPIEKVKNKEMTSWYLSKICTIERNVPFMISTFIHYYRDDEMHVKFVCNGFIVSATWAAIGKNCIKDPWQWTKLTIRSGSLTWNKGGYVKEVVGLGKSTNEQLKEMMYLKINTPFNDEKNLKISLPKTNLTDFKKFYSVGWNDNNLTSLAIEIWTVEPCEGCSRGVLTNSNICTDEIDDRPLVTADRILIGYLKTKNCLQFPGIGTMVVFQYVYEPLNGEEVWKIDLYGRSCIN